MKISLIHPSRSRATIAHTNYKNWMSKTSGENEIEHIISIDMDDPEKDQYEPLFPKSYILCNDNDCVVKAANLAAGISTGNILVYMSDDFDCPKNWDKLIVEAIGNREKAMLRVNDLLQPMDNCVLTIPIMTRGLYEELGSFFYPEYKSMWVDVDLYFTTKHVMIEKPELVFEHKHHSKGCCPDDETYKRSEKNWNQGVDIFNRRSKEFNWGRAFNRI